MNRVCIACQKAFVITTEDMAFYDKVSPVFQGKKYQVPAPIMCFDCRQQRRQAFRNERKIYHNTCSLCKKDFLSLYSPDKKFTVYCAACWWSDQWDPMSYGRDFDFSRSFYEQWQELWIASPKLGIMTWGDNVNCDYTNDIVRSKNCYLVFDGEQGEDSFYGETFHIIKDSVDFLLLKESELCYECVNCLNCYNVQYSQFSQNCSDSYFLQDCIGCKSCYGCCNLRNKEYYIFNQPHTKEEFEKFVRAQELGNFEQREKAKKQAYEFFLSQPKRAFRGTMNENSSGNNISNCSNIQHCFDCTELRDSRYCTNMMVPATDCYDLDGWGENTSHIYNSVLSGLGSHNIICGHYAGFNISNAYHSIYCWHNCHNIFGCINLRHKEYCILNKQYSKEEYEKLVPKIIEHMQQTGEWAEFYPPTLSAFGYNESVANEYFPLSREAALAQGFLWSDYEPPLPNVTKVIVATALPNAIAETGDDILEFAISCEVSKKLYRITKAELKFYRDHSIPLPHRHPDQRHTDRMNLRPPRTLWSRNCAQCHSPIMTPYSTTQPETVVCENCYQTLLV